MQRSSGFLYRSIIASVCTVQSIVHCASACARLHRLTMTDSARTCSRCIPDIHVRLHVNSAYHRVTHASLALSAPHLPRCWKGDYDFKVLDFYKPKKTPKWFLRSVWPVPQATGMTRLVQWLIRLLTKTLLSSTWWAPGGYQECAAFCRPFSVPWGSGHQGIDRPEQFPGRMSCKTTKPGSYHVLFSFEFRLFR